jgi:hypothetical protein
MVFLSYFLFKKYYITWFIIWSHYKLNVFIYYRLLIVCNTSCLIWTTILWRKMLCRVYSLFHRILKKHYHLNFSLFIEYIVTYYCPFSFLLRLCIIEVFIDITGNRLRNDSHFRQISSFLSCQQKNHLLKVLSDQLKCKAKTKVNSKCSNKENDQRSGVFDVSRSSGFFTRYVWIFIIKIRKRWNYLSLVWYRNNLVCNWSCVLYYKTTNNKWICKHLSQILYR